MAHTDMRKSALAFATCFPLRLLRVGCSTFSEQSFCAARSCGSLSGWSHLILTWGLPSLHAHGGTWIGWSRTLRISPLPSTSQRGGICFQYFQNNFVMPGARAVSVHLGGADQQSTQAFALMRPVIFTLCNLQSLLGKADVHLPRVVLGSLRNRSPSEGRGALPACQLFYELDAAIWILCGDAETSKASCGFEHLMGMLGCKFVV